MFVKEWQRNEAITIKELIEILSKYPQNMKVMTTWESTTHPIKKEFIYESFEDFLFIDADNNSYKDQFAKDPKENED